MEAPEKIYLQEPTKVRTEKKYDNDVEYTRTDAFIEKAMKYVTNHFLTPGMDNEIKDFLNYMKGK